MEKMISINLYINEKLHLGKTYKPDNWDVNTKYNQDLVWQFNNIFRYKSPQSEYTDYKKMQQYFDKKSDPKHLINSTKNIGTLCKRFWIAVTLGWDEYAELAKNEIIDRGYFDEDTVNSFIEYMYKQYCEMPKSSHIDILINSLNNLRTWA